MRKAITEFSINRPWAVIGLALVVTIFFGFQFPKIQIDTDPENMLAHDEPVRVFNEETKDGRKMKPYSDLLEAAIQNLVGKVEEAGVASLFSKGGTALSKQAVSGLEDFELISFLVIK